MIHRPILTHTRAQLAEALTKLPGTKALVIEADSVEVTEAPNPEFVIQSR